MGITHDPDDEIEQWELEASFGHQVRGSKPPQAQDQIEIPGPEAVRPIRLSASDE